MRKCPMCGNLTMSFSCNRCTGMPMTVESDFLKPAEPELCQHVFQVDEDHLAHKCCQKCGKVVKT